MGKGLSRILLGILICTFLVTGGTIYLTRQMLGDQQVHTPREAFELAKTAITLTGVAILDRFNGRTLGGSNFTFKEETLTILEAFSKAEPLLCDRLPEKLSGSIHEPQKNCRQEYYRMTERFSNCLTTTNSASCVLEASFDFMSDLESGEDCDILLNRVGEENRFMYEICLNKLKAAGVVVLSHTVGSDRKRLRGTD